MEFGYLIAIIITATLVIATAITMAAPIMAFAGYVWSLFYSFLDKTFNERFRLRRLRRKNNKAYHFRPRSKNKKVYRSPS